MGLSSATPSSRYDVFLSFSGTDTRNNFTRHLLAALNRQGFSPFRDDTKLQKGEDIRSQLPTAIAESRVSIVVFSRNYAASGWCLDELVKIVECRRDFQQIVMPIFYDVDPSDVRKQSGFYAKAFKEHEDRFKGTSSMERLVRWREALTEAANLSSWHLQNVADGDESKLIDIVIEEVVNRLDQLYLDVADHPVGIDSRVQELTTMLKLGSDDAHIVAIWGVGGIGKTTIAKAVFNSIRNKFECNSFLADVSEKSKTSSGVVTLQKQLLSDIQKNETHNLNNYHQGIEVIRKKLGQRRVLLVLDDVDHVQQLRMLAINRDFLFEGSKIIITTKNKSSLISLQVDSVYSPAELNDAESLKLFSWNAFKTDDPEAGYTELSKEVVAYAEGLPLALEVLGLYFSGTSKAEWESGLGKLKKHPHNDIHGKLKLSFESLDKRNQELFLDIAFYFVGRDRDFTVKVLKDSDCFPEIGITELDRRCLLRVDENNVLRMHNLLRDTAREIVYEESLKEPGERSRLRGHKEVLHVLRNCTGTKAIEGLHLELHESNDEHVSATAFRNMSNLRLLHLNYLCHLSGTYKTTSRKLKWLCWHGFPLSYIPADLYMENIVAIELQYSKLKQIWKGRKRLDELRFLNLSHSRRLTKTPDFSGLRSLEELLLHDCTNLVEVHNSIGCLDKLVTLNMANCKNLRKVPSTVLMLKSLQQLDLSGCCKLMELAQSRGTVSTFWDLLTKPQESLPVSAASTHGLSCLRQLNLADCNISYIPSEIGNLTSLEQLHLGRNSFCSLPSSFNNLSRLQTLGVQRCVFLKSLPDLPNNLKYLAAMYCRSLETESIKSQMGNIKFMSFDNVLKSDGNNFEKFLEYSYEGLYELTQFFLDGKVPNDFQFQGIGSSLSFVVPPHVGKKICGWIVCAVICKPNHTLVRHQVINKTNTTRTPHQCTNDATEPVKYRVGDGIINPVWYHMDGINDVKWLKFVALSGDGFKLEGGDEVDLVCFCGSDNVDVKRCGIRLMYEDDDNHLEFIDQASNDSVGRD